VRDERPPHVVLRCPACAWSFRVSVTRDARAERWIGVAPVPAHACGEALQITEHGFDSTELRLEFVNETEGGAVDDAPSRGGAGWEDHARGVWGG
jgi:hypothetical protein